MNFAMATLGLKVSIAKFIGKMQKKVWYYEKWVGRRAMPFFLLDNLLKIDVFSLKFKH